MLFNSIHFLIFLVLVIPGYFLLRPGLPRKSFLLVASYYFYMVFSVPLVLLMAWATLFNYLMARWIQMTDRDGARKLLLALSVAGNLGLLFFFKYFNFVSFSLASLLGADANSWVIDNIVLPMGISFYTFQAMSFTIDVYRRDIDVMPSLMDFTLFISFFPQLVAGPIMRTTDLLPQFNEKHEVNLARIQSGLGLCLWGLMKKSFIADPMGRYAAAVFGSQGALWSGGGNSTNLEQFSSWAILMATWAFAIQIYCDFSGYSDVASGVGRMLGFRIMVNFDRPYLATSVREFWRRWHISLSTWLRDYLYIPLGGNRKGRFRTYFNLFATMVLGGLWHGANWTFVAWGALHGALMSIEQMAGRKASGNERSSPWAKGIRWFVTFQVICLSWIFFRAATLTDAVAAIQGIVALRPGRELGSLPLVFLVGLLGYQWTRSWMATRPPIRVPWAPPLRWAFYPILLMLGVLYVGAQSPEFLYFQF